MVEALRKVIHHGEDQVLVVNLGPSEGRARDAIEALGRSCIPVEREAYII